MNTVTIKNTSNMIAADYTVRMVCIVYISINNRSFGTKKNMQYTHMTFPTNICSQKSTVFCFVFRHEKTAGRIERENNDRTIF